MAMNEEGRLDLGPRTFLFCLQSPALHEVLDSRWRLLESCKILYLFILSTFDLSLVFFNFGYLNIPFNLLLGLSVLSFLSDVLKHIVESVQSNNVLPKIWKTQKLRCSYEVVGPAKQ